MRNRKLRGNLENRRRAGSWRKRDFAIMFGRAAIAVSAIVGLFALGHADYGPPKAPHGSYIVRPATDVERLTHDLRQAFEMDKLASPSPNPGWGAD